MASKEDTDDTSELFPSVKLSDIASITVSRVMVGPDERQTLFVLPFRWPADTTAEDIGAAAGGGIFRAQPRNQRGRYMKGVTPVEFIIDAPEKRFTPPGEMPPVEGAEEPRRMPTDEPTQTVAGGQTVLSVPIAQALPGMPSAMMDYSGLSPETRALVGALYHQWALTQASVEARSRAEADASKRVHDVSLASIAAIGTSSTTLSKEVIGSLERELGVARAKVAESETTITTLRTEREADRVELSKLRTVLGLGLPTGELPQGRGWVDVVKEIIVGLCNQVGAPVVAKALNIPLEMLQIPAKAGSNGAAS